MYRGSIACLVNGETVNADYCVKSFDEGSEFGINGGRISKLTVKINNEYVANYDREWDIKPTSEAAKIVLASLIEKFN